MGVSENISFDKFPHQGTYLGRKVKVCYHYDTSQIHHGIIVREDEERPGVGIIRVIVPGQPDRYVLMTECQYSLVPESKGEHN